jgi:hypothetical protein
MVMMMITTMTMKKTATVKTMLQTLLAVLGASMDVAVLGAATARNG